jgi:predicted Zn-dependent protease
VRWPDRKVLLRQTYDGQGGVRWLDDAGKELAKVAHTLTPAEEPALHPDCSGLVLLALPLRSRAHVLESIGLDPSSSLSSDANGCYQYLEPEDALALLTTVVVEQNADDARRIFRDCFAERGDLRLGLFTLLAAAGVDLEREPAFRQRLPQGGNDPLLAYLALHSSHLYRWAQGQLPLNLGRDIGPKGSFLQNLAEFHDLARRWDRQDSSWARYLARATDRRAALGFISRHRQSVLGWALLAHVQAEGRHDRAAQALLADTWGKLAGTDERSLARYEQARCLLNAGSLADARQQFLGLYERALKDGVALPIDRDFRRALLGDDRLSDQWTPLMLKTAAELIQGKRRPEAVRLAWQCYQVGDRPLADNLLRLALDRLGDDRERLLTTLAAVEFLRQTSEEARAEDLLQDLLRRERFRDLPQLWRQASRLAEERGHEAEAVSSLAKALDLEFAHLPEVIDVQAWRRDYGRVLQRYQALASALKSVGAPPPADLAARTIRMADRWRLHDPESENACRTAAQILRDLGMRELAWEYLTTPLARQDNGSGPLRELGAQLSREGDPGLADHAYRTACDAEPDNALLTWERAINLRQAGQSAEAERLLRQLAEQPQPEGWRWIQARARWELERK